MNIFVSGAAGFLGRHIVDLFSKEKHEITTIVRPTSDPTHLEKMGVKMVQGDLHDPECIARAAKDADVIVHAAATLRGSWDDFYAINVEATKQLLDVAVQNKTQRFIFISSVIVYDHSNSPAEVVFNEQMAYEEDNQTWYCKTKVQAESLVNRFHEEKGLATTILRPAAIYGKSGPLFISRLGFAIGGNRYLIVGDGRLQLPLSHVEGIARAVKLSVEKSQAVGQTYNVTEEKNISQNEYFNEIRRYVKPKFSTIKLPYGLMKFMSQSADKALGLVGMTSPLPLSYMKLCATPFSYSNEKIKTELGWKPCNDYRESIREMMSWHHEVRIPKRQLPNKDMEVPINSSRQLRVGVIGCGVIADPHLKALKRLQNAQIVALCDPVAEARSKMAAKYRVAATYSDFKEMFENQKLDVVHVCTPAQTHSEISIAAMKLGIHVFVEKPFALNAAEARKMLDVAKKFKVKLCVDHNHIFDKVMIRARDIMASGALGRISHAESWYGTSYSSDAKSRYLKYEAKQNWAYDMPGSLYQNFISHPISLLMDVMDNAKVENVQATYHCIVPHQSSDELQVTFGNDQMSGLVKMSMAVSPRYLFVNVYGTAGTLRVDFLNKIIFVDNPGAKLPRVISRSLSSLSQAKTLIGGAVRNIASGLVGKYNMYQGNETLIRLFYLSIIENTPEPILPEEGLRSMEIMDEIWKKMNYSNGPALKTPENGKTAPKVGRRKAATPKPRKSAAVSKVKPVASTKVKGD